MKAARVGGGKGGHQSSSTACSCPERTACCAVVSVAQVAIAWVIARAAAQHVAIIPLVGARRRDRLAESLGALSVKLSNEQLAGIERAVPPDAVAGERYPEAQLAHLDSERSFGERM